MSTNAPVACRSETSPSSAAYLIAAVIVHLSAPQAFITAPMFVEGMVRFNEFPPAQAGYVAAAENLGKAVAATVLLLTVGKVDWRSVVRVALGVLVVGNVVSMLVADYPAFLAARFVCGLAPGIVVPLAYAMVGLTPNPDRNFGLLLTSLLVYASVAFLVLPVLLESFGLQGALVFYAAFALLGLAFSGAVPSGRDAPAAPTAAGARTAPDEPPRALTWLAVATMAFYFVGMTGAWAYMSLIATSAGLTAAAVSKTLTLAQPFGILGGLAVVFLAGRLGRIVPIAVGLLATIAAVALLGAPLTAVSFAAAAIVFTFFWNNTHPYLLAAMSSFDSRGRLVVYATAVQMYGVAAGPAVAAFVLGEDRYDRVILAAGTALAAALACILPALVWQRRAQSARANSAESRHQVGRNA